MEDVRKTPFNQIVAKYGGSTSVSQFTVAGLASGLVQVILPIGTCSDGVGLSEQYTDSWLKQPMDLNGDGVKDNLSHSSDYTILPVTIRVS
jgi:hypothetical protein